jgi:hypothetical protein
MTATPLLPVDESARRRIRQALVKRAPRGCLAAVPRAAVGGARATGPASAHGDAGTTRRELQEVARLPCRPLDAEDFAERHLLQLMRDFGLR